MRTDRLVLGAFLALLLLAHAGVLSPFYVTLLNYIGLYAMVALGLVLLTGVGGLTSFGQAAFVGWAPTPPRRSPPRRPAGLDRLGGDSSPWLTLWSGLLLTALVAVLIGSLTLKLSGHFLPLGTIAWGISLYFLFGTIESLGGHTGISGIPPSGCFGWTWMKAARSIT
jgi:ABC-type branched-subunit amino acid transport system permease subunit